MRSLDKFFKVSFDKLNKKPLGLNNIITIPYKIKNSVRDKQTVRNIDLVNQMMFKNKIYLEQSFRAQISTFIGDYDRFPTFVKSFSGFSSYNFNRFNLSGLKRGMNLNYNNLDFNKEKLF